MSKIRFLFAAAVLLSTTVSAQNVTETSTQGAAFVGEEKRVQYLDGNPKTSRTCLELGIAVGAYDNTPNEVTTELVVTFHSINAFQEVNPGSKFILKINGENVILITPEGTQCQGGLSTYSNSFWGRRTFYKSVALYPISGENLDKLLEYGFTKYRLQFVGGVKEDELSERDTKWLRRSLNEEYTEVRKSQDEISNKVNDLSDF